MVRARVGGDRAQRRGDRAARGIGRAGRGRAGGLLGEHGMALRSMVGALGRERLGGGAATGASGAQKLR